MPSTPTSRTPRLVGTVLAALLLFVLPGGPGAPRSLQAQDGGIRLLVVDDETGEPVAGAFVRIKGRSPDALTDESGRVTIENLPAGRLEVEIGAIGYLARREQITIQAGQLAERRLGLEFTGDKLPELVVVARREKLSNRYQDFHRRMAAGGGVFITWDVIKARGFTRLGDALRGVRGVHVICRTHECNISMSRSRTCPPTVWVDGVEMEYFGANTPIGDVYGIEVYRGAGEMPAEFVGTSGCGAVVIWTKNRPYR